MNTVSAPPAKPVLVWDAPVRVFHWLMVLCFAGAYLSAESERWRLLHISLGYTMAALVGFRIIWGLVGTRYARFAEFMRGPSAVVGYVQGALRGQPKAYTGHNPAGALAIAALLLLTAVIAATGWAALNEAGGKTLEELHEGAAKLMLAVIAVHLCGVVLSSWLHKTNLVRAMVTGYKPVAPGGGIANPWYSVAVILVVAVCGFWYYQWQTAPLQGAAVATHASGSRSHDGDDD